MTSESEAIETFAILVKLTIEMLRRNIPNLNRATLRRVLVAAIDKALE